nr:hypothetical protein Iba_chr03bCG3250 [Ipomoea batatas]
MAKEREFEQTTRLEVVDGERCSDAAGIPKSSLLRLGFAGDRADGDAGDGDVVLLLSGDGLSLLLKLQSTARGIRWHHDWVWQTTVLLQIGGSGRTCFDFGFGDASLVMEESRRSGDGGGRSCFPPSTPAGKSSADLSPLSGNIVTCLNCGKRGHRAFECRAGKNVTSSSLRQHGSMGQPSVNQSKLRVNGVRDSNNNGGNIARLNNQDETQQSKIYVMRRT